MQKDRHNRGMRGPLMPRALPGYRTSTQKFDAIVMEVVARLERHLAAGTDSKVGSLSHIEFAVDEVPPQMETYDSDVVEDSGVPLARLYPAQPGTAAAAPRIVVYRRPIEIRASSSADRELLIQSVLAEQLSSLLGIPPEEFDY